SLLDALPISRGGRRRGRPRRALHCPGRRRRRTRRALGPPAHARPLRRLPRRRLPAPLLDRAGRPRGPGRGCRPRAARDREPHAGGLARLWLIAEMRVTSLVVMAVVAICQAVATITFQTVTNNRIITPSIMGFESL